MAVEEEYEAIITKWPRAAIAAEIHYRFHFLVKDTGISIIFPLPPMIDFLFVENDRKNIQETQVT